MMQQNFTLSKKFITENFPVKTFFAIVGIWLLLAVLNFLSLKFWKYTGCDLLFPFSVLYPNNFLWTGFLSALTFLFLGFYAFRNTASFSTAGILGWCILLVLFGNLSQGNLDIAFEQPFYFKGRQYYHDVLPITDIWGWLRDFTKNQDSFQLHTRTHPPFVIMLHYFILRLFNGSILALGVVFFLISAVFFLIFNGVLKNFNFNIDRRKQLLVLASVVPSVNIYLLVSIDGIILMTSSLVLLGVSGILRLGKVDLKNSFFIFLGILLTNMLSFSGLFLFAFLGIAALFQAYRKNYSWLLLTGAVFVAFVLSLYGIYRATGYSQYQAFHHASASENPDGFMLLSYPYIYFWTRVQDIAEILIFLSFAFTSVLFSRRFSKELWWQKPAYISFSAFAALMLMFLTGAYGTGETARACLFIVPYFLILLKDLNNRTFQVLCVITLLQTFAMQLIGNFFW